MEKCEFCEKDTSEEELEKNKYYIKGDHNLCNNCIKKYDDKTGYCSFDCCMGLGCDGAC